VTEYLLDHQWIFDARYNLNCTTALLTRFKHRKKGYFADQNLEVEIIAPADPSAPPKMVAAGQADLAISYQPQLHLQIHEGLPLQRVGTLVATSLSCLLVLADGPIETFADLKGRKVGFSVGGVEDAVLGHVLATHGLTLEDVELINVN
jgi:putative hydroxymethylpyrimidine transport system substrate-binding protein